MIAFVINTIQRFWWILFPALAFCTWYFLGRE